MYFSSKFIYLHRVGLSKNCLEKSKYRRYSVALSSPVGESDCSSLQANSLQTFPIRAPIGVYSPAPPPWSLCTRGENGLLPTELSEK